MYLCQFSTFCILLHLFVSDIIQNYLGHSINAPTGRWQKNKDVHWYNRDVAETDEARREEIRKIKEAEEDALSVALYDPISPFLLWVVSLTHIIVDSNRRTAQSLLELRSKMMTLLKHKQQRRKSKRKRQNGSVFEQKSESGKKSGERRKTKRERGKGGAKRRQNIVAVQYPTALLITRATERPGDVLYPSVGVPEGRLLLLLGDIVACGGTRTRVEAVPLLAGGALMTDVKGMIDHMTAGRWRESENGIEGGGMTTQREIGKGMGNGDVSKTLRRGILREKTDCISHMCSIAS